MKSNFKFEENFAKILRKGNLHLPCSYHSDMLHFFYRQPVYQQLALGWQIAKQLQGSTLFH